MKEKKNLCHSINTLHGCVEPNEALRKEEMMRLRLFFTKLLYASLLVRILGLVFLFVIF